MFIRKALLTGLLLLGLSCENSVNNISDAGNTMDTGNTDASVDNGSVADTGNTVDTGNTDLSMDKGIVDTCTPKTCQDLSWECGTGKDGCGGTLDCGVSTDGKTCSSTHICIEGSWTDPTTGYEWQITPSNNNGNWFEWKDAVDYCQKLDIGGHTDWHLPKIGELRTLIRSCADVQTGGTCKVDNDCLNEACRNEPCSGCEGQNGPGANGIYGPPNLEWPYGGTWYWSSSPVTDTPTKAWQISFNDGYIGNTDKTFCTEAARCVRNTP